MIEQTTLAERLSIVFGRMIPLIPDRPGTGRSLFDMWNEALGSKKRDALLTASAIGTLSTAFAKLQAQVEASKRLKDAQKRSAMETLTLFQGLFNLNAFTHDAHNYKVSCSAKSVGDLGIIGVSLEREFSEPRLDKANAEELSLALRDISELLKSSEIPIDLQVTLQKHLNAMLWWLSQPDITSPQDLYEAIGAAGMVAGQIAERTPDTPDTSGQPSIGQQIVSKTVSFMQRVASLVGATDKGIILTDRIVHDGQHLLQTFHGTPGA